LAVSSSYLSLRPIRPRDLAEIVQPDQNLTGTPFPWQPGDHLSLIGETGSGKSTLAVWLLKQRRFVVVLRTKVDDIRFGMEEVVKSHRAMLNLRLNRIELRPDRQPLDRRRAELFAAYRLAGRQGGWTLYTDETWFVEHRLGLTLEIEDLLTQGRSQDLRPLTMALAAQRPARISRFVLSQATHVIAWNVEPREAKTLAESTSELFGAITQTLDLETHEFGWFHRPSRKIWRGRFDPATETLVGRFVVVEEVA
jgi:hypothetical protein